jgi:hypothetical protein
MSSVWMAERTDGLLKRRIALKLPHVGWALPDLAERMRASATSWLRSNIRTSRGSTMPAWMLTAYPTS